MLDRYYQLSLASKLYRRTICKDRVPRRLEPNIVLYHKHDIADHSHICSLFRRYYCCCAELRNMNRLMDRRAHCDA